MNTLTLSSISKKYANGEQVLDNLNLQLEQGLIYILHGPSGCGKTTLLQIAGLLDSPTTGKISFHDEDCSNLPDNKITEIRGKGMGFIYQFHHLLPELTALENVALPHIINFDDLSAAKTKAIETLTDLGLTDKLGAFPNQLSGGQQQRVAVARALINDPKLILADEPTGNLDHENAIKVFDLITQQVKKRGSTALIVTHNIELLKKGDRVITIKDGKIEFLH